MNLPILLLLATHFTIAAALTAHPPRRTISNAPTSKNYITRHNKIGACVRIPSPSHLFVSASPPQTNIPTTTERNHPSSHDDSSPSNHYSAVIVGGGPAGLLTAIMLAQLPSTTFHRFSSTHPPPRIAIYDRLPPPPPPSNLSYSTDVSKYYLLGLGHRGQRALRRFDVWDAVAEASVPVVGRKDWSPGKTAEEDGVVRLSSEKLVETRVLARDKLVGVLRGVIETRYADVIELNYGYQVDPITFGQEGEDAPVKLAVSQCIPVGDDNEECRIDQGNVAPKIISADFLVGADGAARTIANAMERNDEQRRQKLHPIRRALFNKPSFRVKRFVDDNQRVYKSIPISFPKHWPSNLNYSARSTNNRAALEALPSDANGNYCALLLLRPDDELARAECDPKLLREFFDAEYPQFSPLIGDDVMSDVAKKGASALPGFRFAGPRLHEGGRTVILGDAVHTVKPYYGLGANTALEDVSILSDALNSTPDLPSAVQQFTKQRATDSRALVTLSRGMDRPGKIGTMRFVLPLILDSMFHKLAPRIFDPSMFGMFQMEGVGFREIQLRKRRDRLLQALVIGTGISLFGKGVKYSVRSLAKATGLSDVAISCCMLCSAVLVGVVRNMAAKRSSAA
ncbi:hypothetical protein HJC23_011729 [Cyclotella cryptica]|uniref:FAD-binding domain-containing protein n=1 Tax=Cyclotella cryptica TaxID=29204 RepID=A0ABD3NII5_9STRA|eukprot:CCRYP_020888-RA/>CCRYP_020888-RA protein AED:0.10 eAED:0.10 QI:82/1/1/1/1/1/2/45/625